MEDRVAAVACAHRTEACGVHVGFFGHSVDGGKVVADVLAAVVLANLVVPFLAEAGQPAPVGRYYDVAVGGHELKVPAV